MDKQIDIFGNEVDWTTTEPIPNKGGRQKWRTMQEIHGELKGKKCKNCVNFLRRSFYPNVYFKCKVWHNTASTASDIRANGVACRKYKVGD